MNRPARYRVMLSCALFVLSAIVALDLWNRWCSQQAAAARQQTTELSRKAAKEFQARTEKMLAEILRRLP